LLVLVLAVDVGCCALLSVEGLLQLAIVDVVLQLSWGFAALVVVRGVFGPFRAPQP
jgi:hypothetical protein